MVRPPMNLLTMPKLMKFLCRKKQVMMRRFQQIPRH